MITEKFIKDNIHYIRETFDNGTINIYPDPDFQNNNPPPPIVKPPLPDLSGVDNKLNFIIDELHLKDRFSK